MTKSGQENRDSGRRRTLKAAKILFKNEQSMMDCQPRDISVTGAKVRFAREFPCPEQFKLRLLDGNGSGILLVAERVWSHQREIGMRFINGTRFESMALTS